MGGDGRLVAGRCIDPVVDAYVEQVGGAVGAAVVRHRPDVFSRMVLAAPLVDFTSTAPALVSAPAAPMLPPRAAPASAVRSELAPHPPTVVAEECVGCGLCEQACLHLPQAIRVLPPGAGRSERVRKA